jgi:heat shock protein HtpX
MGALERRRRDPSWNTRDPTPEDGERLRGATERLCLVAEMHPPETRVVGDRVPLSYMSARLGRRPRLTVTTGMLDCLPDPELRAVVGHELTHLVQRDALVMGMLAAPSRWALQGAGQMFRDDPLRAPLVFIFAIYFLIPMLVLGLMARVVSRHRALSADRGSAILTGSAAAMASALRRLADDLRHGDMLKSDLKLAATGDELHVLPSARRERRGIRRMRATHPPLERRLAQLDEMETHLQASRGSPVAALAADPGLD